MHIRDLNLPLELTTARQIAEKAFSTTPDASLDDWFSFPEMEKYLIEKRGKCLIAVDDSQKPLGMIYAQQENPINGPEGLDKWVIILAAVVPEATGKKIGEQLLQQLEKTVKDTGATKMFVFTNKDDDRVIHFYQKNGYENAGWIRDYQYGKGNSAIFLLKYL